MNDITRSASSASVAPQLATLVGSVGAHLDLEAVFHPVSQFELMTEAADRIRLRRTSKLLAVLLMEQSEPIQTGSRVLWPLWAEEAMHHTHSMLKLLVRLERRA